jgi:thiamine biosynthesis lipoprotein
MLNRHKYMHFILLSLLLAACTTSDAGSPVAGSARVERSLGLMGTSLELMVEARDRATALAASELAVRALETTEARLSTWRTDSELARLNATPAYESFHMSSELAAELTAARRWWLETDGRFDPGVGGLVQAWGLREGGRRPSPSELTQAQAAGGLASLALDGRNATREHADLLLEEGGFGKGAGLDAALSAMREGGATRAVLDLGGQVALLGSGPFQLAVAHPDDRNRPMLEVTVDGGSLATSGNSERGIVVEGEHLGHLLDPRTGQPAEDFGSITVWAQDAMTADCLSTALYVAGPDAALAWVAERPGIEVIVVERSDGSLLVRPSDGLRGRLRPLWGDLEVRFSPTPSEQ